MTEIKKRLIDANAFKVFLEDVRQGYLEEDTFSSNFAAEVIETVQDNYLDLAPTVDAVEVVHGWWIELPGMEPDYKCSECGRSYAWWEPNEAHYCPNCGAKMDEETKFVGICERCEYRDECDWPKLHPKIELKKCPDFNEGEKNKNG